MKSLSRSLWLPALSIFILNLGMYLVFLPDQMSWAHFGNDGGDYLAAILTRGVPHPTGYPTYILLNFLFQLLPFSTPYWRGAFFSACMAALSSALFYAWLYRQLEKHSTTPPNLPIATQPLPPESPPLPLSDLRLEWIAILGSIAWGCSPFLFSEAVIVDVHSLHAVFLILGLFWIDTLSDPGHPKLLFSGLLAFLFGLGLGNHITLIFLFPAAVVAAFRSACHENGLKRIAAQIGPLAFGLLVYLYLPWSAAQGPPVNWGNPQTLAGFGWLVGGSAYRGMLVSVRLPEYLPRLALAARLLVDQFGPLGVLLGIVGAGSLGLYRKEMAVSLAWCAAISLLFALTYAAVDWTTYLLPVFIVWCAWMTAGLALLWPLRWRGMPLGMLAALLFGSLLLGQVPATLRGGDPRSDKGAARYVQSLFAQAPPRAIILTSADLDSFPLWYYHLGLKQRSDLHVIVSPLTVFDWYRETIQRTYPDLSLPPGNPPANAAWENLLTQANPGLPVCETTVSAQPIPRVDFKCNR